MKAFSMKSSVFLLAILVLTYTLHIEAQQCNPSGGIRGTNPPPGQCNQENDSDCCKDGENYTTYNCSPPVSRSTKATLTLNSFQKGGDGGAESACDEQYHSDDTPVVALSTGWYSNRKMLKSKVDSRSAQVYRSTDCEKKINRSTTCNRSTACKKKLNRSTA